MIKNILILLLILYSVVFFGRLYEGIVDAESYDYNCTIEFERRIDYLIPSHKLGCWLGEKI